VAGYSVEGTTVTPLSTVSLQNEQGRQVPSPDGMAFDNGIHLWIVATDGNLYRYARAELIGGGVIQP
jgi:hypothetical protein